MELVVERTRSYSLQRCEDLDDGLVVTTAKVSFRRRCRDKFVRADIRSLFLTLICVSFR